MEKGKWICVSVRVIEKERKREGVGEGRDSKGKNKCIISLESLNIYIIVPLICLQFQRNLSSGFNL